jgi:hypothetical protein
MKIASKSITVEPLFKNKEKYIDSSIEDSEAVLAFERNDADLKKLSQVLSEQTVAYCLPKCMYSDMNSIFSFSIFRSGLPVTELARFSVIEKNGHLS